MPRTPGSGEPVQLDSGAWRVRCTGPDGTRRSQTFPTKSDARAWLATQRADIVRRTWRATEVGKRTVGAYAVDYLARSDLRESTKDLYRGLWARHLEAPWDDVPVGDITTQAVRAWHATATRTTGPTALAQSYRLLRAILNVAVQDEVVATNPCRLRSAGTPKPARASRSLSSQEVLALSMAVPDKYTALILVLAFGGLRFGEATALRRTDVSANGNSVRVERSVRYISGAWHVGPPKSEAGRRSVALPEFVAVAVRHHLSEWVPDSPEALVFGTKSGRYLHGANFGQTFRRAVDSMGDLPPVRVHELRHTGATLAAAAGASTKELMRRIGHASPAAALVYQHAVDDRDAEIARALDALATATPTASMEPIPADAAE